jgi:uncharacterized membrane protein YhaH (DUF805 family)
VSCWATLGVDPHSDPRTVKRAYARLLKDVHPEEHPEAFMALREAYERALAGSAKVSPQRIPVIEPAMSQTAHEPTPSLRQEPLCTAQDEVVAAEQLRQLAFQQGQQQEARAKAIAEQNAFQQRLEQLANNLHNQLTDPQKRACLAQWETLLLAPELNSLNVRTAIGRDLLPALLDNLSDSANTPVPAAVLLRLDERFQWSADQGIHWGVSQNYMERLSLLVDAAQDCLSAQPTVIGWRWFIQTMFDWNGSLSRGEYLLGTAMLLGLFLAAVALPDLPLHRDIQEFLYGSLALVMAYGCVIAFIKRIKDSGVNVLLAVGVSLILPFSFLLFVLAANQTELTKYNPRTRYVDLYKVALLNLFRDGYRSTMAQRARSIALHIHPNLIAVLVGSWLVFALTIMLA